MPEDTKNMTEEKALALHRCTCTSVYRNATPGILRDKTIENRLNKQNIQIKKNVVKFGNNQSKCNKITQTFESTNMKTWS